MSALVWRRLDPDGAERAVEHDAPAVLAAIFGDCPERATGVGFLLVFERGPRANQLSLLLNRLYIRPRCATVWYDDSAGGCMPDVWSDRASQWLADFHDRRNRSVRVCWCWQPTRHRVSHLTI